MTFLKKAFAIAMSVALIGCSSIVHDSTQNVYITSIPAGASLQIDGRRFTTPATVPLKGKSEYYFTVDAPGYQTATGKVDGDFRVWSTVVGNIFNLSGFIGFAIDFWGSKTAFELQKNNTVTLVPLPVTTTEPAPYTYAPPAPAQPYPYGSALTNGAPVPTPAPAAR